MEVNDIMQAITITKQYYELGLTQDEIAKIQKISKSTVSRILKKSMDQGYVSIKINHPIESIQSIENEFYKLFDIEKVFVTPAYVDDFQIRMNDTCKALATDLVKMVHPGEIISVSWGRTMEQLINVLTPPPHPLENIRIVQLSGSVAKNVASTLSSQIVEKFSSVFSATGYLLPAPVLVDSKEIADAIMSDSQIKMVLDMTRASDLAVMSIGNVNADSIIVERGSLTEEQYKELMALGAVGDVAARYFNVQGELVHHQINERTIGITIDEFKRKKERVALVVGVEKTKALVGALRGKIINYLYVDEITAKSVLKYYKGMEND